VGYEAIAPWYGQFGFREVRRYALLEAPLASSDPPPRPTN
jgi:hypothetical protein